MSFFEFTFLDIFLGILGFGLSILFCTTLCKACSRLREEQIQREVWRRGEQDGRARPIYFIPFPRNLSQDSGDQFAGDLDPHLPPSYNPVAYGAPPPSYHELGLKPDDLPPAYTEHSSSSVTPPPRVDVDTHAAQPPAQPQA